MEIVDLFSSNADLSLPRLAVSLVLGALIAELLQRFFVSHARSTSDARYFSRSFAPLLLSIVLIIAVIRTSLALSLGLVGALSIVRFRTPVKDPEELIFLLMVIAAGIGLGAEQWLATICAIGAILGLLALRSSRARQGAQPGAVTFDLWSDTDAKDQVEAVRLALAEQCESLTTLRAEATDERTYVCLRATGLDESRVLDLIGGLQQRFPLVRLAAVHSPLYQN